MAKGGVVGEMLTLDDEGGRGFEEMLTMIDKWGGEFRAPPF